MFSPTACCQAIRDNAILGAGFGTFQDVFPVYRDSACAGVRGVWERAHNVFLEGWLGLGAPFLVALAIGYAVLIGVFVHGARKRRRLRFAPIIGLAALVLATLHSIVDFSLQIPGFMVYFAAATAAAATISLGRGRT
jgi:O-antigen ligase